MKHLLVTNDFPPKLGGIQSYLWELWRRLPPEGVTVLTTAQHGDTEWDAEQPFRVVRSRRPVLLPTPGLVAEIDRTAGACGAELVLLDPALPAGLVGPRLARPYGVVLHGAEVTVPGRLPGAASLLRRVLRGARLVVAAGDYPAAEATRAAGRRLPIVVVPPGVDVDRFRPLAASERRAVRAELGVPVDGQLVVGVSRLVPRKGFDVVIEAAARLAAGGNHSLTVAIAGAGRDRGRLERLARRTGSPALLVGRVGDDRLPALYGAADVFAMACRNRWFGLEQEGFGIVFLEAAAAGVAQVAGRSGGSTDAVSDGVTGVVVDRPRDASAVAHALATLLDDDGLRARMAQAARQRAVDEFAYDVLAARLATAIEGC